MLASLLLSNYQTHPKFSPELLTNAVKFHEHEESRSRIILTNHKAYQSSKSEKREELRPAHDSLQQHRHSPHYEAPLHLLQQVYQLLKIRAPRRGRLRWATSIYHFLIIYSEKTYYFHNLEASRTKHSRLKKKSKYKKRDYSYSLILIFKYQFLC